MHTRLRITQQLLLLSYTFASTINKVRNHLSENYWMLRSRFSVLLFLIVCILFSDFSVFFVPPYLVRNRCFIRFILYTTSVMMFCQSR